MATDCAEADEEVERMEASCGSSPSPTQYSAGELGLESGVAKLKQLWDGRSSLSTPGLLEELGRESVEAPCRRPACRVGRLAGFRRPVLVSATLQAWLV